jgi:hypothetical protein
MKKIDFPLLILVTFFVFSSCRHNADLTIAPPKPPDPGPEFKCSHDTVYFQNSVLPVILNGCAKSGCHDQSTGKGEEVLDNYSSIHGLVIPFDPQNSKLYYILFNNSEGRMPPDVPLTTNQKSFIYWWIAQGAYNNHCDSAGCDSANVTYNNTIRPILETWCLSCHSGSSSVSGIPFDTYDQLVVYADNGHLMGAIRQEQGYSAMPQGPNKLSTCEINLFQKWIDLGKP